MTLNREGRPHGCVLTGCGWPNCGCALSQVAKAEQPSSRNAYQEMVSLCGQLRRQVLTVNGEVAELEITLPVALFRSVLASLPPDMWPTVTVPHDRQSRNTVRICGVNVYEAWPDGLGPVRAWRSGIDYEET